MTALQLRRPELDNRPRPGAPAGDRDARARAVLERIAPVHDDGFTHVLATLVDESWRRSVARRAERSAPGFLALPLVGKLRAGYHTYCALGLSAIACSRRRPRAIAAAARVADAVGLGEGALAACARRAMPWLYRVPLARELDRVAAASAFIILIDQIFDDELVDRPAAERVDAVRRVVGLPAAAGAAVPRTPAVSFACALVDVLRAVDPLRWPAQAARVVEWAECEVRLEAGDPSVEPRRATIDVSMELLGFAAGAYVGDVELAWMQGIARLGQMVDDVLDVEKDLAAGRVTLGATGGWNVDTVASLYHRLLGETAALLDAAGERHPATRALYERTFRAQIRHMAEVLVDNP